MASKIIAEGLSDFLDPGIDDLYERAGRKYNISPVWLKAQDLHEIGAGGGDATAGDAEHIGHGQIGPAWRKKLGLPDRPSAEQGIFGMAQIMRELVDKHGGDFEEAAREYTGGPSKANWGENTLAYPGVVKANYSSLGGLEGRYTYPAPSKIIEDGLKDFANPPADAPQVKQREPSDWGFWSNTGEGLTLGQGHKGVAGAEALLQTIQQKNSGDPKFASIPFNKLLQGNYNSREMALADAKARFGEESPNKALVTELVGSTIPTMAAMAAGYEGAVAPLARHVSASFPRAAPVVNYLTGNISREAGMIRRGLSKIVPGATGGLVSSLLTSGLSDKPVGEQAQTGTEFGALAGPLLGRVGDVLASNVAPRAAGLANRLINAGVPLEAGQIPGVSPIVRMMHNWFGDTSGSAQRQGLTRALTRTFGEASDVFDNDVATAAQKRIGQKFEQFKSATINKDRDYAEAIVDTLAAARGDVTEGGSGIPKDKLKELDAVASALVGKGNTISGERYLNLTQRGSELDRLMHDPLLGHHAAKLRDALDDALERSTIAANGRWVPGPGSKPASGTNVLNPREGRQSLDNDFLLEGPKGQKPPAPGMVWEIDPATQQALKLLREARGEYKNLKLATGLLNDATGEIQPKQLATRVAKFYPPSKDRAMTSWERQMRDLAGASQFIPQAATAAPKKGFHVGPASAAGYGLGAMAIGKELEPLWHMISANPTESAAAAALLLGSRSGAKGITSLMDSPRNTSRIVQNALLPQDYGLDWTTMALMPPIVEGYNYEKPKRKSK